MTEEDEEFQRIEREAALRGGVVQGNRTVIEMARKAFETPGTEPAFRNGFWTVKQEELERFAALVRADERNSWPAEMEAMERQVNILTDALAQEREACAKVIESHGPFLANGAMLAEAIRARSDT